MAAKPMPRLRAGISGTSIIPPSKRSLPLHVKSKTTDGRSALPSGVAVTKEAAVLLKRSNSMREELSGGDAKQTSNADSRSAWDVICTQLDFNSGSPGVEKFRLSLDNSTKGSYESGQSAEVANLKELLQLQISLISRQQDLLKLRDKEIMQLTTTTQSYKSRLERMQRRIQLSQRQSDLSNSSAGSQLIKASIDLDLSEDVKPETSLSVLDAIHSKVEQGLKQTPERNRADDTVNSEVVTSPFTKDRAVDAAMRFTSPVSLIHSAYAASGCVPVPMSYVDRYKNQFPPSSENDLSSVPHPLVIKVCEHCTYCSSMANEIKREVPISNEVVETKPLIAHNSTRVSYLEQPANEDDAVTFQSLHPYHLITWPRDDQSNRLNDLDLSYDKGTTLNIPTWKENKLAPLASNQIKDVKEYLDEETFQKRHGRLEVAEKRRKRWDIQRIREYRYNEKLRQRQLKHGPEQDDFETFSPCVSDIRAVQVDETLPVNVFGRLLQPLRVEEFSLVNDM